MSDRVLEAVTAFGIFGFVIVAIAILQRSRVSYAFLGLSLFAFGIWELAYEVGRRAPIPLLEESSWNWSSKIYATLALLALVVMIPSVTFQNVGLTTKSKPGAMWGWGLVIVLCGGFVYAALQFSPDAFEGDWDALAFQLTMPSIEEELFFRGLLLLLIDKAFDSSRQILGAPLGWGGIVASIMFGLIHGVSFSGGEFSFAAASAGYTFLAALILVWLRAKTGNLMAPIIVHSFGNSIFYLI